MTGPVETWLLTNDRFKICSENIFEKKWFKGIPRRGQLKNTPEYGVVHVENSQNEILVEFWWFLFLFEYVHLLFGYIYIL